ncbi:Keratin, type I cytoskeletal 18 [Saguinus oedipus]|uniref:Keratin, type I cytoskeletal 18 n=1 Tax=Saguinus oedipus TaxID=9490 RepID=A0ABQ9WAF4_SAGOE|nr:Keratin, type I cytoskeletal 18 [Saguinus oedipus]
MRGIQNEKQNIQNLSDHLASYLDRTIEDLRALIFANTVDNACTVLQIYNACLAADDFRVKYETELSLCQSVLSDIHGLCKVIDDTNVSWLQLETEIKAVKEELLFLKKNHKEEAKGLQVQIASSGLTMGVDTPYLRTSPRPSQTLGPVQ